MKGETLDRAVFSGAFSAFTIEGGVLLLLLFGDGVLNVI